MILIIGASGTLGKYLQGALERSGLSFESPSRSELDISSSTSVINFFQGSKCYDMIYLLAAETDVDLCERNPSLAYTVNVLGVDLIAKYAAKTNTPVTYISTSAVFGGGVQKWRYCELDTPIPVNLYGSSKLHGEYVIKNICRNYFIVRSSWMIGGGVMYDKKFLSKIIPALKDNKDISIVHDKFGSLTYAKDLAEFLVVSYKQGYSGTKHFSSSNYVSRYDIAKYIASILKVKSKIIGIDSCSFPLSAPRATSEALYSIVGDVAVREWQDIIQDYLKEWL